MSSSDHLPFSAACLWIDVTQSFIRNTTQLPIEPWHRNNAHPSTSQCTLTHHQKKPKQKLWDITRKAVKSHLASKCAPGLPPAELPVACNNNPAGSLPLRPASLTHWVVGGWVLRVGEDPREHEDAAAVISVTHNICQRLSCCVQPIPVPCYFCIIGDALSTRRCKLWSRAMCAHIRTHTVHKVLHRRSEWRCNQREKVNPTSIERRN